MCVHEIWRGIDGVAKLDDGFAEFSLRHVRLAVRDEFLRVLAAPGGQRQNQAKPEVCDATTQCTIHEDLPFAAA